MATSVVSPTSIQRMTPYITGDMFKTHARAGVQVESLVPKGTPADQEAALLGYIEQGSAWIDRHAEQSFAATADTVQQQVNVGRDGFAEIHPRFIPVIGLTAFSVGPAPSQLSALSSLSGVGFLPDGGFTVPVFQLALTSSQGPIQFGGITCPWDQAWCQYTYVNGYPITYLTAATLAAGATSVAVADTTGIVAGKTWLTIYSGKTRYRFLAGTVSNADAGGLGTGAGTVGCAAVPFAIDNPAGQPVMVSALPPDLILASVLATRGIIKQKGITAVVTPTARSQARGRHNAGDDLTEAWELVQKVMQTAVTA